MYRVTYGYLHNEYDAKDALQEMSYQALKNMHKVKSPQFFKIWLVRIVINTCLMQKRQQKRIVITAQIADQPYLSNEFFELNDAIMKLPIDQQELIHLKYFIELLKNKLNDIPYLTI